MRQMISFQAALKRTASLAALLAFSLAALPAAAQEAGPGWFVPKSAAPPAAPPADRGPPRPHPVARAAPRPMPAASQAPDAREDEQAAAQIPLPPVPDLPALAKETPPPAVVIGVLGVPEVMRASVAAQSVEKTIRERREKLNQDAQKELSAERDMGQSLAAERGRLAPDQQRARERALQERAADAQKRFRDRDRVIQQAAQYGLNQIERTLIAVIRQVSESRGMNIVVHRAQVALNQDAFDITAKVTEQLNRILPGVDIPPEGVVVAQYVAQKKARGEPLFRMPDAPAAVVAPVPGPAPLPAPAPKTIH